MKLKKTISTIALWTSFLVWGNALAESINDIKKTTNDILEAKEKASVLNQKSQDIFMEIVKNKIALKNWTKRQIPTEELIKQLSDIWDQFDKLFWEYNCNSDVLEWMFTLSTLTWKERLSSWYALTKECSSESKKSKWVLDNLYSWISSILSKEDFTKEQNQDLSDIIPIIKEDLKKMLNDSIKFLWEGNEDNNGLKRALNNLEKYN